MFQSRDLIDLHVHSTASDGSYSPAALVDYFESKAAYAFALTDHDTISGIGEAMAAAADKTVRLIPGIEVSCGYLGGDVHILGLFADWKKPSFCRRIDELQEARLERNRKMLKKLSDFGFDISEEAMRETFGDAVITRAHFARYLCDHGYVNSVSEAFDRYLRKGCPCYVPKEMITIYEAMDILKEGGAVPVLAHPMLYHFLSPDELELLIDKLIRLGLKGIETIYSENSPEEEARSRALAAKYGLCITGGSDFHGKNKPAIDILTGKGNLVIKKELLDDLRSKISR